MAAVEDTRTSSPITSNGSRKRPRSSTAFDQNNASCKRCREKKIKCDNEIPTCRSCSKTGSTCVIVDSSTGKEYTRSQLRSLQEQIQQLEVRLQLRGIETGQSRGQASDSFASNNNTVPAKTPIRHIPKFIGDESGTGGWKEPSFSQPVQDTVFGPTITDHPAHPLPSLSDGAELINTYLTGFHIQHSFLQRKDVQRLYQCVYERDSPTDASAQPAIGASREERKDLFRLNLIFALASIDPYRKGNCANHPFGYFTAGLRNLNGIMGFETVQDVQGFLLIAHFGLYYYIGCSIWELCQICLRICIEHGLHKTSRAPAENLLVEQMGRRIFWSCYQLDRLSSVTLGRPFGIEDSDIEICLPYDAEDEYLEQITRWSPAEASSMSGLSSSNGEVAVFNCCIRLGRIACRIHTSLNFGFPEDSHGRKLTAGGAGSRFGNLEPGDTYQLFREFFSELKTWRISCPIFSDPQSPCQTQEWFQFMYEREQLTLVRAVIDRVHSRASFPPKELLNPCHNIAAAIIHTYDDLRKRGQVTYSWSYMQLLLSCGLSVVFCVFVKLDNRRKADFRRQQRSWLSHRWIDIERETFQDFSLQQSSAAIDACAEIHSWMADQSKEMARYARFFSMMRRGVLERIKQAGGQSQSAGYGQPDESIDTAPRLQNQQGTRSNERQSRATSSTVDDNTSQLHDPPADISGVSINAQPNLFTNPGYIMEQPHDAMPLEGNGLTDQNFSQLENNWSSAESEDTFEPLVRQLFGADPTFGFQDIDFSGINSEFSTWDFPRDPLLEEFASGLEGFM